jgi:hypothetical protein
MRRVLYDGVEAFDLGGTIATHVPPPVVPCFGNLGGGSSQVIY